MRQVHLKLNNKGRDAILDKAREYGLAGYDNLANASGVNPSAVRSSLCATRSINPEVAESLYTALGKDPKIEFLHDYAESTRAKSKQTYQDYFEPIDLEQIVEILKGLELEVSGIKNILGQRR